MTDEKQSDEKKGRIYWDEAEKTRVVEAVFAMRQNDPESSLIAIINRAQKQLPKDRRRSIPSVKAIPWIRIELQKMFDEQRKKARSAESADQAAESAKERQARLQEQLQGMVKKARESALQEAEIEELVGEVLGRFIKDHEDLRRRVNLLEAKVENSFRAAPAPAPVTQPAKLPTVLVVGLLPDQQNKVRAHFRNAADMRFLGSNERSKGVPQADAAVINTKFIPHNLQSLVQRKLAATGGKVYLVSGGLSSVIERVEQLLVNGTPNA